MDIPQTESSLAEAVPYTPAGFRAAGYEPPPSTAALWRWRTKGVVDQRPETYFRGNRRYIRLAAIEQFFLAVTKAKDGQFQRASSPDALQRAEKELANDGI